MGCATHRQGADIRPAIVPAKIRPHMASVLAGWLASKLALGWPAAGWPTEWVAGYQAALRLQGVIWSFANHKPSASRYRTAAGLGYVVLIPSKFNEG